MRLTLVFPTDEEEQQIGEKIDKHSEDVSTMRHREVHHDEISITGNTVAAGNCRNYLSSGL